MGIEGLFEEELEGPAGIVTPNGIPDGATTTAEEPAIVTIPPEPPELVLAPPDTLGGARFLHPEERAMSKLFVSLAKASGGMA